MSNICCVTPNRDHNLPILQLCHAITKQTRKRQRWAPWPWHRLVHCGVFSGLLLFILAALHWDFNGPLGSPMIIILISTYDYDGYWYLYGLKLKKQTCLETGWHLPSKVASCVNESLDTHPLALSAQLSASAGFSVGYILHIGDIGHWRSQHFFKLVVGPNNQHIINHLAPVSLKHFACMGWVSSISSNSRGPCRSWPKRKGPQRILP